MAGMQMGAHPPATHGDTTQAKMGAMDVQRMPSAAKDSAHMNMPNMPSNPDSAHMNAPGMAGMPGMAGDKRDSTPGAMKGMPPGMRAQASMDPYVTAITTPLDKRSVMLMVLPDFQVARFGRNFFTGMLMAEYGLPSRLTIGAMDHTVLRDRHHLAKDGFVVVVLTVDELTGELIQEPQIITRGCVYSKNADELIEEAKQRVRKVLHAGMHADSAQQRIKETISQFFYERTKGRPMVLPLVIEV